MPTTYKNIEEKLILPQELDLLKTGELKGYIKISRDGSRISYRVSGKKYGFESEKEKIRAYFLVNLIEKYKYHEKDIELDREVIGMADADMLVYKDSMPYIVIDCESLDISEQQKDKALKELVNKADALKADYAVLAMGSCFLAFKMKPRLEKILDIPLSESGE